DLHLLPGDGLGEVDEEIRRSQVPLVLGDLVLEDQVVAERVPGELGHQPVVLVEIFATVGQDEVGRVLPFELLEELLDLGADVGEEAVAEILADDFLLSRLGEEPSRALECLGLPLAGRCSEHAPRHFRSAILLEQPQQRAAAPDLDVVAVRAQAQDFQGRAALREAEGLHRLPYARPPPGILSFQTSQGALPALYMSVSSWCSLNVSIHQNWSER